MTINGNNGLYKVSKFVDQGGLGKIWVGLSIIGKNKGKIVAIKEPRLDIISNASKAIEYIKLEIDALQNLNHKNIVKYYDNSSIKINLSQDIPILITEFIENAQTLREFVDRRRSLSENDTIKFILKILNTLELIHSQGYVWRDLNPNNILIRNNNLDDFVLIDFGTCKKCNIGQNYTLIQFMGYSAPELFQKGIAHPPGDLYSLACVIFKCVTGKDPAEFSTDPFTQTTLNNAPISQKLKNVIRKGFEIDPSKRYQTVDEFERGLTGFGAQVINKPHVIAFNQKYPIIGNAILIGRNPSNNKVYILHEDGTQNEITEDTGQWISRLDPATGRKGQIKISQSSGKWILETYGKNIVAVFRTNSFDEVPDGKRYQLRDGDIVALCWSPIRGSYITLNFKEH